MTFAVSSPIGRHFHIFYPNFVRAARKRGVECADELIFIPDHRCIAQVFRPIGDRNRTAPQRQHKAVGQREIVEADAQVGGDPLVRLQCMDTRAAVPAQRARKALAIRRAKCKIAHIFRELARRRFERRTLRRCAQRDTCPLRRKAEPRHRAADDLRRLCHAQRLLGLEDGQRVRDGTPEEIYNEPKNAFVADFIGESNIVDGLMIHDELVEIFGAKFACVDKGFGNNQPVDVVIRPEDIDLVKPEEGTLQGVVTHLIFKGVHYEMEVTTPDGYEWLVHSTDMFPVGEKVGIHVDPFDIQIMNKPASEDEEAVGVNE